MRIAFRVLYLIYKALAWGKALMLRRFTHAGLAVLCAVGISSVMAVDTEHNVEYQALALLGSILAISLAFGAFFRGTFEAQRMLPRFGTAGMPLTYKVRLKNLGPKTQAGIDVTEKLAEPVPNFREWMDVQMREQNGMRSFRFEQRHRSSPFRIVHVRTEPVPELRPGDECEVSVTLKPLRRGVLRFEGLVVGRPDPLGLFRAVRNMPLPQGVLILPKRYMLPYIALPGTEKFQEGGVAMASSVGQSDEFVSLRDYRRGDPMRHIHWRSWARVGEPVVKEFEDEFFVRHALVLDTFTKLQYSEAFEEAVSVAASFACSVQTQESLLDLLFAGTQTYCFTAGRGLAHNEQILEVLAAVQPCAKGDFNVLENLVLRHSGGLSGCLCVFLQWDEARQSLVRKLRQLGVPVMVLVIALPGANRPAGLGPMDDQPDKFHMLRCGSIEQDLRGVA